MCNNEVILFLESTTCILSSHILHSLDHIGIHNTVATMIRSILTNLPANIPQVSTLLSVFFCANTKNVSIILDGIRIVRNDELNCELYEA